jgi:sarcosine oxidase delta subunit
MPSAPLFFRDLNCPHCGETAEDTEFTRIENTEDCFGEGGTMIFECPVCKQKFSTEYEYRFYNPEKDGGEINGNNDQDTSKTKI